MLTTDDHAQHKEKVLRDALGGMYIGEYSFGPLYNREMKLISTYLVQVPPILSDRTIPHIYMTQLTFYYCRLSHPWAHLF